MRHKLGIATLAALMALAGTREAYQQLDGLKTSFGDWTRTSILGNLLVSAAAGEAADSPATQQQPTVTLAQSRPACNSERARSSSQLSQSSRTDATAKAANTEHARSVVKREGEPNPGESALNFADARGGLSKVDAKTRERLIVRAVPQIAESSDVPGASEEIKVEREATRARSITEHARSITEADHARVATEWKKLGLRKVFVRVAREGGAHAGKGVALPAPAAFDPHTFATAFTFKSITGLDEATDVPAPPGAGGASHDAPSDDELSDATSPNFGFDADSDCPAVIPSLDCEGDPLG